MKRLQTTIALAAVLFASSAAAFDPADLQRLKDTGKCADAVAFSFCGSRKAFDEPKSGCDLTNANLHFLHRFNLRGANLTGANLAAVMKGATLCNTTMPDGSVINSGCGWKWKQLWQRICLSFP